MRLLGLTLLALVLPFLANAQQIRVQSGEHEDFTRLVFSFQERIDWKLRQGDREAVIDFDRDGLTPDFSTVFELIPKNRLEEISIDKAGRSVRLQLACFCSVEAYWFNGSFLVVDVSDEPPEVTVQLAPDAERADPSQNLRGNSKNLQNSVPELSLTARPSSLAASLAAKGLSALPDRSNPQKPSSSEQLSAKTNLDLEGSRTELVKQLGRAATQGLLSPKEQKRRMQKKAAIEQQLSENGNSSDRAPSKEEESADKTVQSDLRTHVNVQTSVDIDFLERLGSDASDILIGNCLSERLTDVARWGNDEPFWDQIAPLRAALTTELDDTVEKVAIELAQKYIYFGFGSEALQILDLVEEDRQVVQVLRELAFIIEEGYGNEHSILKGQLDCEAPVSFWSALSYSVLPANEPIDVDAVMRGFSALPLHLRAHLGPSLSRAFLNAGMKSESGAVLRILERNEETRTPNSEMAKAELELQKGEADKAIVGYQDVVETNSVPSSVALVRKIETAINRGEKVSFEVAQLAGAYAYERALQDDGKILTRAYILALAASGSYNKATSELSRFEDEFRDESDVIRAKLTEIVFKQGDQVDFLKYFFAGEVGSVDLLKPEVALGISERMIDLGFHDFANQTLDRNFDRNFERNAKLLRAEIALQMNMPRKAEVELLGLDGKDVNGLRARARSLLGQYDQSVELFASAGMEEDAQRHAWLAEVNRSSETQGADLESEDLGENPTLARSRAVAESANSTFDSLETLLTENPMPQFE